MTKAAGAAGEKNVGGFDFNSIATIEFYVCYDQGDKEEFFQIPVDTSVQEALNEMLRSTLDSLGVIEDKETMEKFSPAQKYSSEERLRVSLDAEYLEQLRQVLQLVNIQTNPRVLDLVDDLSYYFAVFRDAANRKLLALRRAAQFKGIVKARMRLIKMINNTLTLEADNVFKLDSDFDYIVFDNEVFILRPSGFEFTANLGGTILASSRQNASYLAQEMPYLAVDGLAAFAVNHKRAARLLAALSSRNDLNLIDKKLLFKACKAQKIVLKRKEGKFWPKEGAEYDFLCVLDRRLYSSALIPKTVETYEAPNRILRAQI